MELLMMILTIAGALLGIWSILVVVAALTTIKGWVGKAAVLLTALGWMLLGVSIVSLF